MIDDVLGERLTIEVDDGPPGLRVVRTLDDLGRRRPLPNRLVIDDGSEFTSRAPDAWA